MAQIGTHAALNGEVVPFEEAQISIGSSAVLYGLSVYTVFFGKLTDAGMLGFRLDDHLVRLQQSANMIGLNGADSLLREDNFLATVKQLIEVNNPSVDQFFRVTIHATELVPGVKTADLELTMSVFMYDAVNILPQDQARIKTSLWRRTADTAIPARAKVNGAYVNSALAKQDALNSGFDDCLFLNQNGYVSELSAANIFMVKNGALITPDCASDILEGITRRSIIHLAKKAGIEVIERKIALTELYTAEEVFACGTSAFISPITEIDTRTIGTGTIGTLTTKLREQLAAEQENMESDWATTLL
jgi:branched-chain amino acid aminotransferase